MVAVLRFFQFVSESFEYYIFPNVSINISFLSVWTVVAPSPGGFIGVNDFRNVKTLKNG